MPTFLKVNSWIDCGWCTWRLLDHLWDSESCRKEWERFWLLLAGGGRGEGQGQECPAGDVQCVVVRFGGQCHLEGHRRLQLQQPEAGRAPSPRAAGSAGSEVGAAGLGAPCRSPAPGWGGFALFLDPNNGST